MGVLFREEGTGRAARRSRRQGPGAAPCCALTAAPSWVAPAPALQDGRTQGRVGLGRSSMPKKVAGARWEGKKTKLGSDSEDEEEAEAEAEQQQGQQQAGAGVEAPAPGEVHLGNGVVIVLPPSKQALLAELLGQPASGCGEPAAEQGQAGQQQQQQGQQAKKSKGKGAKKQQQQQEGGGAAAEAAPPAPAAQQAAAAPGGDALSGLKWRKLVLAQLKASGKGKLSVGKLSRAIVKARGLGRTERGRVEQFVAEAAGASSKLSLRDGVVRLAAAQ